MQESVAHLLANFDWSVARETNTTTNNKKIY